MSNRSLLIFSFLVGLGTLQMLGDVFGMPKLKALAAATQVSPAMKVFTAQQGYETHAARFTLHWRDRDGLAHELELAPSSYADVLGPYNRRNVYGAAFAYGPLLRNDPMTRPMHESVMRYAFCVPGTLRAELGIPRDATGITARVMPVRPHQREDLEFEWETDCND